MYLYHYYEKQKGPFLSICDLNIEDSIIKLIEIQKVNSNLVNPNIEWFLKERHSLEKTAREQFINIGGKPIRSHPIYFTVGEIKSMSTWYQEPDYIKIHIDEFDLETLSFTYGDMFPIFSQGLYTSEEYWGKVYKYQEILKIIEKYGYPEDIEYNLRDGKYPDGPPMNQQLKYVEAQLWSNDIIEKYRNSYFI